MMKEKLQAIKDEAMKQIQASDALDKLNDVRVAFLGKKGELTAVLKGMKDVAAEERPIVGQMVNDTRTAIENLLEETKRKLEARAREEQLKKEVIDVTLPAKKNNVGHRHPNTIALEEVERIFIGMGYEPLQIGSPSESCSNLSVFKYPRLSAPIRSQISSILRLYAISCSLAGTSVPK